ncbi:hypothetical protein BGZ72_008720 [Mortierella alpina]|nr:hypothetical protein BGZ72_008720 [Mortierella alpina]
MTTQPSPPAIQIEDQEPERGRKLDAHLVSVSSEDNQEAHKSHSRRSSITDFVERLRSRSRSNSRSRSHSRKSPMEDLKEGEEVKEYQYSRRKSTDMRGEYGAVIRAQTEYMENLRLEQAKNHITHNADGIPIPPPVNPPREGRRRSIIDAISRSSSRGPSRESSRDRSSLAAEDKEYKYSRRKSTEISGPYAAALQSQLEYMENLREEQAKNHVTHNADGIPIPGPVKSGSRRSSVTHVLGLDKSPLSF